MQLYLYFKRQKQNEEKLRWLICWMAQQTLVVVWVHWTYMPDATQNVFCLNLFFILLVCVFNILGIWFLWFAKMAYVMSEAERCIVLFGRVSFDANFHSVHIASWLCHFALTERWYWCAAVVCLLANKWFCSSNNHHFITHGNWCYLLCSTLLVSGFSLRGKSR